MTLKGFYFSQVEDEGLGPKKKILGQIETLKKNGIELELIESPFNREGFLRSNFLLRQIVCRLPFTYVYSKHEYKPEYKTADLYYIRFMAGDYQFVRFIRKLKKYNKNAKIIIEFADFPTTWYMKTSKIYTLLYAPIILKDYLAGRHYKKYIDRVTMLKDYKQAYGIDVIKFLNGVDMNTIRARNPVVTDKIKIIAVASMCIFHGYDRIIKGLEQYYSNGGERIVELHLVGGTDSPGHYLSQYKELVTRCGLQDYVFFYGEKHGEELDAIYDSCNIAAASFGMHRIGYQTANSLKVREYMGKGLPIITGCPIDLFCEATYPYCKNFRNDETLINIEEVITFFDGIYIDENSHKTINDIIRKAAFQYCDMNQALKPIINYILNN